MGSDAEIFIFDHEAYSNTVIPAFSELLRGGHVAEWLQRLEKRRELKPWLWDKRDLSGFSAALNTDLSWAGGPYDLKWTYGNDWQEHWSNAELHFRSQSRSAGWTEHGLNFLDGLLRILPPERFKRTGDHGKIPPTEVGGLFRSFLKLIFKTTAPIPPTAAGGILICANGPGLPSDISRQICSSEAEC